MEFSNSTTVGWIFLPSNKAWMAKLYPCTHQNQQWILLPAKHNNQLVKNIIFLKPVGWRSLLVSKLCTATTLWMRNYMVVSNSFMGYFRSRQDVHLWASFLLLGHVLYDYQYQSSWHIWIPGMMLIWSRHHHLGWTCGSLHAPMIWILFLPMTAPRKTRGPQVPVDASSVIISPRFHLS